VGIVEMLCAKGASLYATDMNQQTALHLAAERKHRKTCKVGGSHASTKLPPHHLERYAAQHT
jgi:ankyrin repeat protein